MFLPLLPLISLQHWENTPVFVNLFPERVYKPPTCTIQCGTHSRCVAQVHSVVTSGYGCVTLAWRKVQPSLHTSPLL